MRRLPARARQGARHACIYLPQAQAGARRCRGCRKAGKVSGPQSAGHRTGLLAATGAPAIRGWCLRLRIVGLTLVHAAMRGPSTASVRHSPATGSSAPHPDTAPLPAHTARPASWRAARPGQRWTCCTQARAFNRTQDTPHPACPHGFRALDGCVCATTISTA